MFYSHSKDCVMIRLLRHILPTLAGLVLFSYGSSAQTRVERTLDNMVLEAVECINNNLYDEAEGILKDVLKVNPNCDAAWYYMGHLAMSKFDADRASECYGNAAKLDPSNFWYRYKFARLCAYMSHPGAMEMYEKLLEDFPKKSTLYYELLDMYINEREYEKALQTIHEIETTIGPSEQVAIYAYRIYFTLGREEEGLEYLRKYNSKYSSPIVLTILAETEMSMYNDDLAFKYFDEALELDPTLPGALSGRAEACRLFRRYNEFFPSLDRYIECTVVPLTDKTGYLGALVEKSDPKFIKRYMPQLDSTMIKLAQTHPGDSLVYSLRGLYYFYTGRADESCEQFREGALAYPESYNSAVDYVEVLMYLNRWPELAEEGRKAYERFPEELAFLEMASMGEYNLGNYDRVLEICDEVLTLAPADSSRTLRAWSTKGDVYHLLGENKKAYKAYDNALKIDPNYIYVLNNYAYYLSVEGKDLKKAYQMSRKTIDAEPENPTYLDTFGWILYLRGEYTEAKMFFKTAMLHGGKESAVILDHYADVLYALKEYDLAFVYWNMALRKNVDDEVPGLKQKVEQRKKEVKR